jgi:hypothetical protein
MSVAIAPMLDGMPNPRTCAASGERADSDHRGRPGIICFDTHRSGDAQHRGTLTEALRLTGWRVAPLMGLTSEYVSELRGRACREGSEPPRRGPAGPRCGPT